MTKSTIPKQKTMMQGAFKSNSSSSGVNGAEAGAAGITIIPSGTAAPAPIMLNSSISSNSTSSTGGAAAADDYDCDMDEN